MMSQQSPSSTTQKSSPVERFILRAVRFANSSVVQFMIFILIPSAHPRSVCLPQLHLSVRHAAVSHRQRQRDDCYCEQRDDDCFDVDCLCHIFMRIKFSCALIGVKLVVHCIINTRFGICSLFIMLQLYYHLKHSPIYGNPCNSRLQTLSSLTSQSFPGV